MDCSCELWRFPARHMGSYLPERRRATIHDGAMTVEFRCDLTPCFLPNAKKRLSVRFSSHICPSSNAPLTAVTPNAFPCVSHRAFMPVFQHPPDSPSPQRQETPFRAFLIAHVPVRCSHFQRGALAELASRRQAVSPALHVWGRNRPAVISLAPRRRQDPRY